MTDNEDFILRRLAIWADETANAFGAGVVALIRAFDCFPTVMARAVTWQCANGLIHWRLVRCDCSPKIEPTPAYPEFFINHGNYHPARKGEMMSDETTNPILTPQQLYDEFIEFQVKLKNNRSLLEVLTRRGDTDALFQSVMMTTQFVIANELHRIANALEKEKGE